TEDGKNALMVANADGGAATAIADVVGSNSPLPQVGERFAWSPDGKSIVFVSATAGPELDMNSDPIVITRYWYRPATAYPARFNDNRRLHLFIADVASHHVRQVTEGTYDEHSVAWSPDGRTIAFLSDRERDPDMFFNFDIFLMDVASGSVRRLTNTKNNEYRPVWSPDGKTIAYEGLKRPMTSSETNSEDTHVWTIDVVTGERREGGAPIDNPQVAPHWSADGRSLYFTVQSRGTVALYRLPATGGTVERVLPSPDARGNVTSFGTTKDGAIVYALTTPSTPAELHVVRNAT